MRQLWMFLLVALALATYVGFNFQTTTDITAFFPESEQREKSELSKAIATSELSRTLVMTLEARSTDEAVAASHTFEALLRADANLVRQLTHLEGGPAPNMDRALWELYQPRRAGFFAPDVAQAQLRLSDAGLDDAVRELRQRLESPLSTLVTRVAPEDPFLTVPLLLERFGEGMQGVKVEQQRYVADGRVAVLFLGTTASALDASAQRVVLNAVDLAASRLTETFPQVRIESSGLARFAVSTQQQIQRDITRISTASVVGLSLLCWVLFRSFRLVYLLLVPIAMGMLVATSVSLALFQKVHGLTFAVGASLIGVCVDYVAHFYAHHLMSPAREGPRETMRGIHWGLALGAGTTIVGFTTLAGSSFPGLRQMAVFAAVGVVSALVTTTLMLPRLVGSTPPVAQPLLGSLGLRLAGVVGWWQAAPRRAWAVGAAAVAVSVLGLFTASWQDSMRDLTRADPELYEVDARVRGRVTRFDTSKLIVAVGADVQAAQRVNERLPPLLQAAKDEGELSSWQGVASLAPSPETQRAVAEVVRDANLGERLPPKLEAAGFDSSMFTPYFEYLKQPIPEPLTYGDLAASDAAPLVRSFQVTLEDKVAFTTFLRGVDDAAALARRVEQVPGAFLIDQTELTSDASRHHRTRTSQLLALGLGVIFVMLSLRYRRLRAALAALLPALLSAGVTVAALSAFGLELNLLALMALMMVLSIGADYGVFLTEVAVTKPKDSEEMQATLVGLFVSWLSTLFGFGLLALSEQPALRTIGVVAGVGVTCSFLLAPASLVLLRSKQASP